MVYLSHIYQLAASARSVVAENKMLRMRMEAAKKESADLVPPAPCSTTRRQAACLSLHLIKEALQP